MNTSEALSSLTDVMTRFTGYVGKRLPTDVMKKLEALRAEEAMRVQNALAPVLGINEEIIRREGRMLFPDAATILGWLKGTRWTPEISETAYAGQNLLVAARLNLE